MAPAAGRARVLLPSLTLRVSVTMSRLPQQPHLRRGPDCKVPDTARAWDPDLSQTAVILVDHGSRRAESNDLLVEVATLFASHSPYQIVEPAHMELAEPSIDTAFQRCVARGARQIVVFPYFLGPGRHWQGDIPRLAAAAAANHPGLAYLVTAPIGLHALMVDIIQSRIESCLAHVQGKSSECDVCQGTDHCRVR